MLDSASTPPQTPPYLYALLSIQSSTLQSYAIGFAAGSAVPVTVSYMSFFLSVPRHLLLPTPTPTARKRAPESDDDEEYDSEEEEEYARPTKKKKHKKKSDFIIDEAEVDEDAEDDEDAFEDEGGAGQDMDNEAEEAGRTAR
jgi:hypothetical protein